MSVGRIILGAALGTVMSQAVDDTLDGDGGDDTNTKKRRPIVDGDDGGNSDGTDSMNGDTTTDDETLDELLELQKKQYGGPESIDAYASEVLDLPDGAIGTVSVTPRDGFNLRVKRLYMDRRDDHDYTHYVGGTQVSENHQAILRSARKVTQGGKVVSEVENGSGSSSVVDFEFEGWGIPSEQSG